MPTNNQNIAAIAAAMDDATYRVRSAQGYADVLTDAQNFIVDELQCLKKIDSTSVVLAAETGEYSLPADFVAFSEDESDFRYGKVCLGTNGTILLTPTTTAKLDTEESGWRGASSGTPQYFYIVDGSAQMTLGVHPKPSSSFISSYGTKVWLKYAYRPAAISPNDSLPFDGSQRLQKLNSLLKIHALWQLSLEKRNFSDADRFEKQLGIRLEMARAQLEKTLIFSDQAGFSRGYGDFS